jgi:hypothetical protein
MVHNEGMKSAWSLQAHGGVLFFHLKKAKRSVADLDLFCWPAFCGRSMFS